MATAAEGDVEFDRVTGKTTTWVLQAQVDGQWRAFCGLFVRALDDARTRVEDARKSRPDLTSWRVIDTATGEVLAEY